MAAATATKTQDWTKAKVIKALKDFNKTNGRVPKTKEAEAQVDGLPSKNQVLKFFPKWNDAIEAAGLEPIIAPQLRGVAAKVGTGSASAKPIKGRWTDEQVALLMETVEKSDTAKEAFAVVAKAIGKTEGTVQQKFYNLKRTGGAKPKRAHPALKTPTVAELNAIPTAAPIQEVVSTPVTTLGEQLRAQLAQNNAQIQTLAMQSASIEALLSTL